MFSKRCGLPIAANTTADTYGPNPGIVSRYVYSFAAAANLFDFLIDFFDLLFGVFDTLRKDFGFKLHRSAGSTADRLAGHLPNCA